MKTDQVINEIRQLKNARNRRSAHEIHQLLENRKLLFGGKLDPDNLNMLLRDFETLANASPADINTEAYRRDYDKAYHLLMFYLEKII